VIDNLADDTFLLPLEAEKSRLKTLIPSIKHNYFSLRKFRVAIKEYSAILNFETDLADVMEGHFTVSAIGSRSLLFGRDVIFWTLHSPWIGVFIEKRQGRYDGLIFSRNTIRARANLKKTIMQL